MTPLRGESETKNKTKQGCRGEEFQSLTFSPIQSSDNHAHAAWSHGHIVCFVHGWKWTLDMIRCVRLCYLKQKVCWAHPLFRPHWSLFGTDVLDSSRRTGIIHSQTCWILRDLIACGWLGLDLLRPPHSKQDLAASPFSLSLSLSKSQWHKLQSPAQSTVTLLWKQVSFWLKAHRSMKSIARHWGKLSKRTWNNKWQTTVPPNQS